MDKQRLIVIGFWVLLLMSIRLMLGFVLHNVWLGTIGAVTITFLIFYLSIRLTPLIRYKHIIDNVLLDRYHKNLFSHHRSNIVFSTWWYPALYRIWLFSLLQHINKIKSFRRNTNRTVAFAE